MKSTFMFAPEKQARKHAINVGVGIERQIFNEVQDPYYLVTGC